MLRISHAAAVFVALGWIAPSAHADTKDVCLQASERGQERRDKLKLRAARADFLKCAESICPAVLRPDCEKWSADVESRIPSIIVRARDEAGHDLVGVRMYVDGELLVTQLDGRLVAVDPGVHKLRFEMAGRPPVEMQVVVREAEKSRPLDVTLPATTTAPAAEAKPAVPSEPSRPIPVTTFVLAGIGVAGVTGFALFASSAKNDVDTMRDTCAPGCTTVQVETARTKGAIANTFLGVGILALGGAVWTFLARPTKPASPTAIHFDVAPTATGIQTGVHGRF